MAKKHQNLSRPYLGEVRNLADLGSLNFLE